jgi:hypothetical protein
MVIELLADGEAAAWERVAEVEAQRNSYRELARQAIHELRNLTVERDRFRAAHHRLLNEYRHLRVRMMRDGSRRVAA